MCSEGVWWVKCRGVRVSVYCEGMYSSGQKKVPVPFSYYDRITIDRFQQNGITTHVLRSSGPGAGTKRRVRIPFLE